MSMSSLRVIRPPAKGLSIRDFYGPGQQKASLAAPSSALHPIYFAGPLGTWGNFVRDVQNFDASQVWSRVVIDHELVSRDLDREKVFGDEHGLQGRFQQSVGQIVAQSIDISFGE
ncbi:hypothetical protein N7501_002949 [Penicillium viridicatum]|nr:hypothetical protein N7501_002949 [Penicillium viridicatum]